VRGIISVSHSVEGAVFQIEEEEVANELLSAALKAGPVRHFEIEEPSLQDIFIAKVGKEYA
jgi:ABC-2 type transport system ATP-binding protein